MKKKRAERDEAEQKEQAEAKKKADEKKRAQESKRSVGNAKNKGQSAAPVPQEKVERTVRTVLVPLPSDLAQWTNADFDAARLRSDPRLIPAVRKRAASSEGKPDNVALYLRLLAPLKEEGEKPANTDKTIAKPLIEALVAVLGENGTQPARTALEGVLAGKVLTEDGKLAVDVALRALAQHSNPENDEILSRAILVPGELRPTGRGSVTAEELQQRALAAIRATGSQSVRLMLAERLISAAAVPETRRLALSLFNEMQPINFEAHALLYEHGLANPPLRAAIEKSFAAYSADTLLLAMGFPRQPGETADPEMAQRVARRLWNPDFIAFLDARLTAMESFQEGPHAVLLAATIPAEGMRVRLGRVLARHWDEGPAGLRAAASPSPLVVEPGFLLALKAAQRSVGEAPRKEVPVKLAPRRKDPKRPAEPKIPPGKQARQDWLKTEEELLRRLCTRLQAAAAAKTLAAQKAGKKAEMDLGSQKLPLELHPGGDLVSFHRFAWPPAGSKGLPGLPGKLAICYVRIEEKARPDVLASYYRRQVKTAEARPMVGGFWLDRYETKDDSAARRSLDVLITRANSASIRGADETQELTVEIVIMEVIPETNPG